MHIEEVPDSPTVGAKRGRSDPGECAGAAKRPTCAEGLTPTVNSQRKGKRKAEAEIDETFLPLTVTPENRARWDPDADPNTAKRKRVSLAPLINQGIATAQRFVDQQRGSKRLRTQVQVALAPKVTIGCAGDIRLASIRSMLRYLDTVGHERSPQQVELQEAMIRASMHFIYRDEFTANVERVMRENAWSRLSSELLIGTPRRFGKTYSTSEYAAVYILSIEKAKVCVYSTGKNTAVMVLDHVRMFFRALPNFADFEILMDNEKEIRLAPKGNPKDIRIITSFTSNPKIRIHVIYLCSI